MPLKLKPDRISGILHVHGTVAGKRIRRSLGTRDRELAEHLAAEIERRELRKSIYGPERETTFEEIAFAYMAEGGERRYLAPILKAFGRNKKVADLSGPYVRKVAKALYPKVKPQTLNRCVIKPVNAVLHFGSDAQLCGPMSIKGFSSAPITPRKAASQEWVARFVHACDDQGWPYIGTYALFLHVTAARPIEAVALGPEHLDLEKKIAISARPTKNGEFRFFYLTNELVRRFRLYPAKALLWGKGKGQLRVFGYADTKGPVPIWKAICQKAGLPYFSPYPAGRKSFASTLISQRGQDIKTTAELGNWKDIRVLLDHYVTPHDIEGFVERNFEGLLARNWQGPSEGESQVVGFERKKAQNED